jgi:hypothetical protein
MGISLTPTQVWKSLSDPYFLKRALAISTQESLSNSKKRKQNKKPYLSIS